MNIFSKEWMTLIAIINIAIGALFCFKGYKFFYFVLGLIGALAGFALGYFVTEEPVQAILFALLGIGLSIALFQIGIFVLGAIFAQLILLVITGFDNPGPEISLVFMIAGGVFALFFHKLVLIVSTSYMGAMSLIAGLFMLFSHNMRPPDPVVFILFVLLLGTFGLLFQYGVFDKIGDNEHPLGDSKLTGADIPGTDKLLLKTVSELEVVNPLKGNFSHSSLVSEEQKVEVQPVIQVCEMIREETHADEQVPNTQFPIQLVQQNGRFVGQIYQIRGVLNGNFIQASIGRPSSSSTPDVPINEPTISRIHAMLIYDGTAIKLQHLSDNNSSLINCDSIGSGEYATLSVGDKLSLANIDFEVKMNF